MKLTIERSALLKSLGHAQSVVERRNTIPILANVLIRAESQAVSFAATDMDLEFIESASAEIGRGGTVTAPAHTLYEIVRKLPEGAQVELNAANSNQLTLAAGRSHFKLGCLPVEDFPQMSEGELKHKFTFSAQDLRTIIDRTRFAISTEETRYYLNGIYLHATRANNIDVLRAVATDGHRLARIEIPAPQGAKNIPGVIIPRKTIQEIRKLLDEVSGAVEIGISETKIRFAFGSVVLTSKLIDGTFPDYEKVIPSGNDKMLDVEARAFASAVDRVATIASEKTRAVKLSLSPGHMTITASSPEAGSASEELEAKYDGPLIDIGFNARYLLDITQQIEGDGLRLMLADAAAPVIAQDTTDASALYVIMPMRV
ncbi:MAG: DNA polymerase III subunit beta [Alphaproteobacteria bacterium]